MAITSAPPALAGAGKYFAVSSGNVGIPTIPSIARFGKGYEVIWVAKTGSTYAIKGRILNAAGKPVGGQITALSGWHGLNLDPTILPYNGMRMIAFAGAKTGSSGAYDNGAEYYLTSSNGKTWTLSTGSLSAGAEADTADSTAVGLDAATPITGFAENQGVVYHVGVSASDPAPGSDPITTQTGNFSSNPGFGVDAKTHDAYALWYSNSTGKVGVWEQKIAPSVGVAAHAPQSSNSAQTDGYAVSQNLTAVGRPQGGVYTAYVTPAKNAIAVWKIGAGKPFATIKDTKGPTSLVITAGPKGRLWLYWRDFQGGWRATRSNKKATRFGPSTYVPAGSTAVEDVHIAANGQAGPLEAIATIQPKVGHFEVIGRQIMPKLSIKAPKSVARGSKLVAKVTDAGDAVKGAKVSFDGVSGKTNKKGVATLKIPHSAPTGKHKATAKIGGYATASRTVLVKS